MRDMPERFADAISTMEGSATHLAKIEAICDWPGLSGGQRMIALTIACLEHRERRPVTSLELSRVVSMPQDRLESIFANMPEDVHAPYAWSELPGRGWCFLPSQGLEYGEA